MPAFNNVYLWSVCCAQLENKNVNNNPVPFTSYMARFRTPYQQSKSTTPLYYSWNLAGELGCTFCANLSFACLPESLCTKLLQRYNDLV